MNKIRKYLALLLLLLPLCLDAQITSVEYFIDNDPGTGIATTVAITPGESITTTIPVDVSSLEPGLHSVGLRLQANELWNTTRMQYLIVNNNNANDGLASMEYFIDNDPGIGEATPIIVDEGSGIKASFLPDVDGLEVGIHTLGIRVRSSTSGWSSARLHSFLLNGHSVGEDITGLEYFISTDPGVGNATQVSAVPSDTMSIAFTPDVSNLPLGMYSLGCRVKSASGGWSTTSVCNIYVNGLGESLQIKELEYFFDTDPGVGNAISVEGEAADTFKLSFLPNVSRLETGLHAMGLRVKTASNGWSTTTTRNVFINELGESRQISGIEYYFDTDPGIGNATAVEGITSDTMNLAFSPNIDTIAQGLHTMGFRVKTLGGKYSATTVRSVYVSHIGNHVSGVEYFFDQDPGVGNGIGISNENNGTMHTALNIDLNSIENGKHTLFIRAQGEDGDWGMVTIESFCKGTVPQFSIPSEACVNTLVSIIDQSTNAAASTTYSWDYDGDGMEDATGSGNKYRNFATAGTYEVSLTVSDEGGCSSTYVDTISVLAPATPSVSIAADDTEVCEGNDVIFRSTAEAKGNAPTYRWLLNSEVIANATADTLLITTLSSDDEIQCELTSDYSCMAEGTNAIDTSDVVSVTVNTIITPSISISVKSGTMKPGSTPVFMSSVENAGNSASYNWLLNGSPLGITTAGLTMPGLQQDMLISCEVSIGNDVQCYTVAKDTSNVVTVDFTGIAPSADFSVNTTSGLASLDVQFTDASTDAATAWSWNFGDGSTESTEQSPSHQYTNAGVYTITLVASNAYGIDTLTRKDYITVNVETSEITFIDWNGTTLKTDTVNYGSDATAPTLPTRTGYTFSGWDTTFTNVSESYTVIAEYTINSYTVSFSDWDGTELKAETVDYGSDATAPTQPSRTGYTFSGWDTTFTDISESYTVTAKYAINTVDKFTVIFADWNDAELKAETVEYGSDATAPTQPERAGYTFAGWDTTFVNISESYTVTAEYTINSYTVTFVDWDGTELKTEMVEYGSNATAPAEPTRTGYSFSGWDTTFTDISESYTVTAEYTINSYTVTFSDWNGAELKAETVDYGSDATAPTEPTRAGYTFSGWDTTFTNISESYTVMVEYTINSYTVTFSDWNGTELKAEMVDYGSDATAPTQPERAGYTFAGWDTAFVNISESYNVTTEYTINSYTVTFVDWNGAEMKAETVEYDSDATAPTQPERAGYTFAGWDTTFVNISESYNVTAEYTINIYTVTFTVSDGSAAIEDAILSFDNVNYMSDPNGIINVTDILANSYTYTVSAAGFATIDSTLMIDNDTSINIVMQRVNAIDELKEQSITIYPNPAKSIVTIEGARNKSICVYTLSGKLVLSKTTASDKEELSVNDLCQGLYIIKIGNTVTRLAIK